MAWHVRRLGECRLHLLVPILDLEQQGLDLLFVVLACRLEMLNVLADGLFSIDLEPFPRIDPLLELIVDYLARLAAIISELY